MAKTSNARVGTYLRFNFGNVDLQREAEINEERYQIATTVDFLK